MPEPTFVAVDLETTGLDPLRDRIIELAAVRFENGVETGSFAALVDPGRPVPLRVQRLTGITNADLRGAASAADALAQLVALCRGLPVVAYNLGFDLAFLAGQLGQLGMETPWRETYDCLELARLALPVLGDHRLSTVSARLGVERPTHRAADDARACGLAFARLLQLLEELPAWALRDILELMSPLPWDLRPFFLHAATRARGKRTGPGATAGAVAAADPPAHEGPYTSVDPEPLRAALVPGSALAAVFPIFEYRPQQVQMLSLVTEALNEGKLVLVEAGTGTGKSIAYLLPAVEWAVANHARVVVSTHTINLQEQLLDKDIPLLRRALDLQFDVALLKGRRNYLCLQRYQEYRRSARVKLDPEEARWNARLVAWLALSETGDRAEFGPTGYDEQWWGWVAADSEYCRGLECPDRERCFVQAARRAAAAAHLVITNHSLVVSDLAAGNRVLPRYDHAVFDEAHHLEDVATEHLAEVTGPESMARVLDAVGNSGDGALGKLAYRLRQDGVPRGEAAVAAADAAIRELRGTVGTLLADLRARLGRSTAPGDDGYAPVLRLRPADGDDEWRATSDRAADVVTALDRLSAAGDELREAALAGGAGTEQALQDLLRLVAAVQTQGRPVRLLHLGDVERHVFWLEGARRGSFTLRVAPVCVGELLRAGLFEPLRGAVLTSATLTVQGRFDFVRERLGLDQWHEPRLVGEVIGSPFAYDRQALVAIPADLPVPRGRDSAAFAGAVQGLLRRLLPLVGGRTLVLFTSHRLLQETYHRLRGAMEEEDICLLAQGLDGSRSRLLAELRQGQRTVVLGSSSFWEGIDVPGAALSCVVMVRLPFSPPGAPVHQARCEQLQREGKPPFFFLALPQAVLRFKQGFGRLIRSTSDRGVVVVCDQRVLGNSSTYGQQFLRSLPGPSVLAGTTDQVLEAVAHWLKAGVLIT